MDNASIHHIGELVELLSGVGVLVKFLPPYSPDINPIEEVFAEVKHYLQANNQTFDSTTTSTMIILEAFDSISTVNCQHYIKHAGYV